MDGGSHQQTLGQLHGLMLLRHTAIIAVPRGVVLGIYTIPDLKALFPTVSGACMYNMCKCYLTAVFAAFHIPHSDGYMILLRHTATISPPRGVVAGYSSTMN